MLMERGDKMQELWWTWGAWPRLLKGLSCKGIPASNQSQPLQPVFQRCWLSSSVIGGEKAGKVS